MPTPLQFAVDALRPGLDVDEERAWLEGLARHHADRPAAPRRAPRGHVARDLREDPALRDDAELLDGPSYAPVATRDGVHRVTVDGHGLLVTALVRSRR